jgi:hypothetical protein
MDGDTGAIGVEGVRLRSRWPRWVGEVEVDHVDEKGMVEGF